MSLSDVMGGAGLAGYAEVALVISLVTFVAIAAWVFSRPREEMEARSRAPLGDERAVPEGRPEPECRVPERTGGLQTNAPRPLNESGRRS